jgi:Holliday junction DNA helicase RuvA
LIGYLKGKVIAKNAETHQCVLLSFRVGYEVMLPAGLFDKLLIGDNTALWIHTHVREDIFSLYGFASENQKHFFRLMLGVSGLGPKSSLALLSEHGTERLAHYIRAQDATSLSNAPGIGKKLAQKIILELQSKMEKLEWIALAGRTSEPLKSISAPSLHPLRDDVTSALLNLGFAPSQVKPTIERIFEREEADKDGFEACLKLALKEMNMRPAMSDGGGRG